MNYLRRLQLARMMTPDRGGAPGAGAADDGQQDEHNASEGGEGAADPAEGQADKKPDKGVKTFTQEDVDKMFDKAYAKWQKKQEKAVSEAERLAKMSEEERQQEKSRQREEELTRREAEITRRELRAQALETLAQKDLPAELAQMLDYTDAEACSQSIDTVAKVWQQAVQKGVETRVAGKTPRTAEKKTGPKTLREAVSEYYQG